MQGEEETDREVVGDHRAREPPLLAQQASQQALVGGGRHAVDFRVGVHHRPRAAKPQCHLERRQHDVRQVARAHRGRGEVAAAAGRGVPGEVLQRRDDAGPLEPADVRRAQGADQVRILADRLLGAPPPVVEGHVHDRGKALVHPGRPHGPPDPPRHFLDELRVERRSPAERRRVHGGLPGAEPGQALLVDLRGDAEPTAPRDPACAAASERAPATGSTGAVPNGRVSCPSPCLMTSSNGWPSTMSAWCGATPWPEALAPTQNAGQLGNLLLKRQQRDQRRCPLRGRQPDVPPVRALARRHGSVRLRLTLH